MAAQSITSAPERAAANGLIGTFAAKPVGIGGRIERLACDGKSIEAESGINADIAGYVHPIDQSFAIAQASICSNNVL